MQDTHLLARRLPIGSFCSSAPTHTHTHTHKRMHAHFFFWRPRKISSACPSHSISLNFVRSSYAAGRLSRTILKNPFRYIYTNKALNFKHRLVYFASIPNAQSASSHRIRRPICIDRDAPMPPQTSHLQNAISMCKRLFQHVRNDDLFSLNLVCASLVELMR